MWRERACRRRFVCLWSSFMLLALLSLVACTPSISGRIDDYGVSTDLTAPVQIGNPELPGGVETFVERSVINQTTDEIEARLGTSFGYHFTISGLKPGAEYVFEKAVSYPAMTLPDGTVSRGYSRELPSTIARSDGTVGSWQGYGLDCDYELLPGPWTIEIKYQGRTLTSKTFELIVPEGAG